MSRTIMLVQSSVGHHKSGLQRSRYRAVVGGLGEIPNLHSRGPEPDIKLARLVGR